GTLGREPAEKPPGSPRSNWDSWDVGDARDVKGRTGRRWKKSTNCYAEQVGTSGPKRRVGHEKGEADKEGTEAHFGWFGRTFLDSTGTIGTK
ncbi:hypothetical protein KI387_011109, partial [Taxus chinensis]